MNTIMEKGDSNVNKENDIVNENKKVNDNLKEEQEKLDNMKNETKEIHDDKDEIDSGENNSFKENVINDYIVESESESEPEPSNSENYKTVQNNSMEPSETYGQKEQNDQNDQNELKVQNKQNDHNEQDKQAKPDDQDKQDNQNNQNDQNEPKEQYEQEKSNEVKEQDKPEDQIKQKDETENNKEEENEEDSDIDELPSNNRVVYVKYNPEAYAKKMLDIESRRYSSISTFLDNQSIISKSSKYRYSDCNFDSFIYDNSFHIDKNDLLENSKISNTIISLNSNDADADFNSERENYRPTEHSLSSIHDDQSESNINYYINHEDIDSSSILGSLRNSSIDEFYDQKDRKSERISIRSRNTSFSSISSTPPENHNIKSLPPPHRIIKKAIRTNSSPIYTSNYMTKTSPYISRASPRMSGTANSLMSINEEIKRRYSNISNLSNISANKSEDKYTMQDNQPMDKTAATTTAAATTMGERQEPKIIKVHSKKASLKKTMSLILESGKKIITMTQGQNQSKTQNKNDLKKTTRDLPPHSNDNNILEQAKAEFKLNKKTYPSPTFATESDIETLDIHPSILNRNETLDIHPSVLNRTETVDIHPSVLNRTETLNIHPSVLNRTGTLDVHPSILNRANATVSSQINNNNNDNNNSKSNNASVDISNKPSVSESNSKYVDVF